MHTLRLSVACTAALLLACSSPTETCACPPALTHAVVYGNIQTAGDQPVEGADVQAVVFGKICRQGVGEVDRDANSAQTDADGAYRLRVYSLYGPGAVCVRVAASSPAGDSAGADVALEFRHQGVAPDSVRVEFRIP